MAHQEDAFAPAGGEVGLQPGPLPGLGGEARVEELRVEDDDATTVVVERAVLRPEMPFPERQMLLGHPGGRRPVVGLVAHVVVAGNEMERMPQRGRSLAEARRRLGVETGKGGHRMHEIAQVNDEGEIAGVQVAHDVPQAAVGQPVGLVGRIAVVLAPVDVGVGDDAEAETARARRAGAGGLGGHADGPGASPASRSPFRPFGAAFSHGDPPRCPRPRACRLRARGAIGKAPARRKGPLAVARDSVCNPRPSERGARP